MTSSNENDLPPVVNSSAPPIHTETAPLSESSAEGRAGGERRPRRSGSGKHPFHKKRSFNKDKPRREGEVPNGPREGGGSHPAKLAPNPADIEEIGRAHV